MKQDACLAAALKDLIIRMLGAYTEFAEVLAGFALWQDLETPGLSKIKIQVCLGWIALAQLEGASAGQKKS